MQLHVRSIESGFLGVLSGVEVNAPALRMALTMVARRLTSATPSGSEPPAAPRVSEPEPRAPKRSFFGWKR